MKEFVILHGAGLGLGVLLDLLIGDPQKMPHPIRWIGTFISFLEKKLLDPCLLSENRDPKKEKRRGVLCWSVVILTVLVLSAAVISGAWFAGPAAFVIAEGILSAFCLAAKSLCRESMAVSKRLSAGDPEGAKGALSMIVGRDTKHLNEEEMIRAAVETVAENTSDGVIAPLLYLALGGPVFGFFYKAVNTMDSMIGYRSERYRDFGTFAARADDVCNFFPSRISALCMIAAAFICRLFSRIFDGKGAWRIFRRDRLNHLSPNSAQTESVCAGALGLKLGGTHSYGGVEVKKPTIGDAKKEPETADIRRANTLMFVTEGIVILLLALLYGAVFML